MFGVNRCSLDYIIIMIGSNMGAVKQLIEKIHAGQSGCFSIKSMDKKFFLKREKNKTCNGIIRYTPRKSYI